MAIEYVKISEMDEDVNPSSLGFVEVSVPSPSGYQTRKAKIFNLTTGKASIPRLMFKVPNPIDGTDDAFHFALDFLEDDDYSGEPIESFDTSSDNDDVFLFSGNSWIVFPEEGAINPYYDNKVAVNMTLVEPGTTYYVRYKWFRAGSDPDDTPWEYSQYPGLEVNSPSLPWPSGLRRCAINQMEEDLSPSPSGYFEYECPSPSGYQSRKMKLSSIPLTIPTATDSVLGGIKVGTGLSIDGGGVLSASSGDWTTTAACARASDSTFTVTDNADNQAIFTPGTPMRYADTAGSWNYGLISTYSSGTVTIKGQPIDTSHDAIFQFGKPYMVQQMDLWIGGVYGDAVEDIFQTKGHSYARWGMGNAVLVAVYVIHDTPDTGDEAHVNLKIDGTAALTEDSGNGLQLGNSGVWVSSTTGIDASHCTVALGSTIIPTCTVVGGEGDAEDLTVSCIFILK